MACRRKKGTVSWRIRCVNTSIGTCGSAPPSRMRPFFKRYFWLLPSPCHTMHFHCQNYRIYPNKRPPRNKRPPKTVIFQRGEYTKPKGFDGWFFKGGSTQNRWILMGDFSKGGVHETDGFWWMSFQRGEYTKPMGFWWMSFQRGEYTKPMNFNGWFFKGGSTWNRWLLMDEFSKGGVHETDGLLMGCRISLDLCSPLLWKIIHCCVLTSMVIRYLPASRTTKCSRSPSWKNSRSRKPSTKPTRTGHERSYKASEDIWWNFRWNF